MKKNIVASLVALGLALGVPGLVIASQQPKPVPVQAQKFGPRLPELRTAAPSDTVVVEVPETTIVGTRPRAPRAVARPSCTWRWRDLVQGRGQVYACE